MGITCPSPFLYIYVVISSAIACYCKDVWKLEDTVRFIKPITEPFGKNCAFAAHICGNYNILNTPKFTAMKTPLSLLGLLLFGLKLLLQLGDFLG